jgi:hypothetical protein
MVSYFSACPMSIVHFLFPMRNFLVSTTKLFFYTHTTSNAVHLLPPIQSPIPWRNTTSGSSTAATVAFVTVLLVAFASQDSSPRTTQPRHEKSWKFLSFLGRCQVRMNHIQDGFHTFSEITFPWSMKWCVMVVIVVILVRTQTRHFCNVSEVRGQWRWTRFVLV